MSPIDRMAFLTHERYQARYIVETQLSRVQTDTDMIIISDFDNNFFEFTIRLLTATVSRSNDGLDMPIIKPFKSSQDKLLSDFCEL